MQLTLKGAIALKDNQNLFEKDGKIWANITWLRLWPKNPRVILDKNLQKLKKQIIELGIYKPLVVTPDGEILGGNQRYKVLYELSRKDARYEWIWVSVVDAWDDNARLKYAISDNFSAGEYTREKLAEIIKLDQGKLFDNYDISIEQKKSIQEVLDEISLSDAEVTMRGMKKELKKLGVNDATLNVLEQVTLYNKINEKLPEVDLQGKVEGERYPIIFWFDDEVSHAQMMQIFSTGRKKVQDTAKMLEFVERCTGVKIPTTADVMEKIMKAYEKVEAQEKDFIELGADIRQIQEKKQILETEFKKFYEKIQAQIAKSSK